MGNVISVLLIEDDTVDAEAAARMLRSIATELGDESSFSVNHVFRLSEGCKTLATTQVHVVLLDLGLPDSQHLTSLNTIQDSYPAMPIVVLSGSEERDVAIQAVRQGAQSYLVKGEFSRSELMRCLLYAIERKRAHEEKQRLEHQLQTAHRLQSLGQLAAGIAHEINTPMQYISDNTHFVANNMTSVIALIERLIETADDDDRFPAALSAQLEETDFGFLCREITRALEQSIDGIHRAVQVLRAMREFSHPSTKRQWIDLNHAVQNAIAVSRNEWKYVADVTTDFDPTLTAVPCCPGEINQSILNLIVNAAHAIADSRGPGRQKGTIAIRTRRLKEAAEILIRDSGGGIPPDVQSRIFEPFFTTKELGRGTGQGLSIAYDAVVRKHRGTITFETEEGKGTKFIVRIPLRPAENRKTTVGTGQEGIP